MKDKDGKKGKLSLPAVALAAAVTVAGVVGGVPGTGGPGRLSVVETAWASERRQVMGGQAAREWSGAAHFTVYSLKSVPYTPFSNDFSKDFSGDFSNDFSKDFSSDFSNDFSSNFSGDSACATCASCSSCSSCAGAL